METTPEKAVAALLREAETAHGAYETNVSLGYTTKRGQPGTRPTCSTTVSANICPVLRISMPPT